MSASSDVMSIGKYQLENLLRTGVPFLFLDLRSESHRSDHRHDLLYGSRPVEPENVSDFLKTENAAPNAAIILLCEDGVRSKGIAENLDKAGFLNVYVVQGGFAAL